MTVLEGKVQEEQHEGILPEVIPEDKEAELLIGLELRASGKVLDENFSIDSLVRSAKQLNALQNRLDRSLELDRWDGTKKSIYALFCNLKELVGFKTKEIGDLLKEESDLILKLYDFSVDIYATFKHHHSTFAKYRDKNNKRINIINKYEPKLIEKRDYYRNEMEKLSLEFEKMSERQPGRYLMLNNLQSLRDSFREYSWKIERSESCYEFMKETGIRVDNTANVLHYVKNFAENLGVCFGYAEELVRELGPGVLFANRVMNKTPEIIFIALSVSKTVSNACSIATNANNIRNLDRARSHLRSLTDSREYSNIVGYLDGMYR